MPLYGKAQALRREQPGPCFSLTIPPCKIIGNHIQGDPEMQDNPKDYRRNPP